MSIRIVVADDHALFRSGLKALLEREADFEIVGEAASGPETVKAVAAHTPDILILDLSMPGGMAGAQVAEAVLAQQPELGLVILTMHEDVVGGSGDHVLDRVVDEDGAGAEEG